MHTDMLFGRNCHLDQPFENLLLCDVYYYFKITSSKQIYNTTICECFYRIKVKTLLEKLKLLIMSIF